MAKEYKNVNGAWILVDVVYHHVYYTTDEGMKRLAGRFSNVTQGGEALMKLATILLNNVKYGTIIVTEERE